MDKNRPSKATRSPGLASSVLVATGIRVSVTRAAHEQDVALKILALELFDVVKTRGNLFVMDSDSFI